MKQITKKAIKEAPEFMIVVDNKAEYKGNAPFDYEMMEAKTVIEAMTEAEDYIDNATYLVKILQKTGEVDPEGLGIIYSAILCNRTNGWHTNDTKHSETEFEATYNPNWSFDPISYYCAG